MPFPRPPFARAVLSLRRLGGALALLPLLGACSGYDQLSGAAATLNREVATLQDEMVLKNILRRSEHRPAHFSALPLIRGRNRMTYGVGLAVPLPGGDRAQRLFEPSIGAESGPSFDYASLNNEQFLERLRRPVRLDRLAPLMRDRARRELLLTVTVEEIRWRGPLGTRRYHNDPEDPVAFQAFQRQMEGLMDQGLRTEAAAWVRPVSPPFRLDDAPSLGDMGIAAREGITTDPVPRPPGLARQSNGGPWYQMRRTEEFSRFCFTDPREALTRLARCGSWAGARRAEFPENDPRSFGGTSPLAFEVDAGNRLEIEFRSLLDVMDYLGALVRMEREGVSGPPHIRGPSGARVPLFRVVAAGPGIAAVATTEMDGRRMAVPRGPAGGRSAELFSFVTHMVGATQSVAEVPTTGAVFSD